MEEIRSIIAENVEKIMKTHLEETRPSQIFDEDGIEVVETKKKSEEVSAIPIRENNMRDLL
jgi:hypothetical protein